MYRELALASVFIASVTVVMLIVEVAGFLLTLSVSLMIAAVSGVLYLNRLQKSTIP